MLRELYAGITDDEAMVKALALVALAFRCQAATLVYVDPARPEADLVLSFGAIDAAVQARYREHYAPIDPAPATMARIPVGTATTTHRMFDEAFRTNDPFYNEFFLPLGLVETMGGPVINRDGRFCLVSVMRGADRPSFDDDEINRFERLMPHLAQAIQLRRTFFEISDRARAFASTVDSLPVGLMIFSRSGRLAHANLKARHLIDRADGLLLDRYGRLGAVDGEVRRRLATLMLEPPSLPQLLRVPRRDGLSPYVARASQAGTPNSIWQGGGHGLLLSVHDPDVADDDVAALLSVALDLSPSASRLVGALMDGADLEGYAAANGISVNTAKFHLKSAFAATGTRRQVDLVRRATAIARDLTMPARRGSGTALVPRP
ncbi:MAG: hypothetical protein U1E14_11295 [Geminicoccaceae bacterium]